MAECMRARAGLLCYHARASPRVMAHMHGFRDVADVVAPLRRILSPRHAGCHAAGDDTSVVRRARDAHGRKHLLIYRRAAMHAPFIDF